MHNSKTAKRYAKALFALAAEQDRLGAVAADLSDLQRLLAGSAEFRLLVTSPLIPSAHRQALLEELFQRRANGLTLRFLFFLEDKGRLNLLASMGDAFAAMYQAHQGLVQAHIASATPLNEEQLASIRSRLGARLGREIIAETAVRPELIGGFRVRVGDTIYDYSIRTQLERVRTQLLRA